MHTVRLARRLRREMSLPERLLWQHLKGAPLGIRFRRQHPAGPFILDFFCARANLAVEIDGEAHSMGDRPARDESRDNWLAEHGIATTRIAAFEVIQDAIGIAEGILAMTHDRLVQLGKTPPSDAVASATSPSQVDGEGIQDRP